jgi:replication fork clamp-binding protein CrfC
MVMNIDAKLNNARTLLNELGNSIANLVNSSPDVFADPGIKSALDGFLDAFEEAVERLENPSFRIATIGTTSSGKSTIVNALIDRKIAPMDVEEMSGGVLTLKHSSESKLIIRPLAELLLCYSRGFQFLFCTSLICNLLYNLCLQLNDIYFL